jgi:hypothetical protein
VHAFLARSAAALIVAASAVTGGVLLGLPAHAATCGNVMTLQPDGAISPSNLLVDPGACVTFHNGTILPAQFTVGAHYKQTAAAFSEVTTDYVAGPAGTTQPVTATEPGVTAHATIVVKPAPSKPAPTRTHSAGPAPRHSSSAGHPSPTPTAAAPTPPARTLTAAPPPVQPLVSPAPGSSPFLAGQPTPTPSSSSPAATVLSGPLQPPTDRGTGLPAAVAALAVAGTAGALVRVLLAEPIGPVDDARTVGATS